MRAPSIEQLVARYKAVDEAALFNNFTLQTPQFLGDSAKDIMTNVPPSFGACAMISAMWAGYLKDHYSIPAVVVAGDLKISGKTIFKCKKNLPEPTKSGNIVSGKWDGHCWIEIDGWIGDLSIFRTAYQIEGQSVLKNFVLSNFGSGKGALISPKSNLPVELKYIPKYVLNKNQVDSLISGLSYQIGQGI
ncbi:hypothetical protein AB6E95_14660 [Vibrio splendidus]|uniref:Transglutaminase-like domain-containing protein n=1 Tax=Vibrio splendidus TaxID=29497 RepID=A0ABV4LUD8_VIBSP